jgi:hypothetical protein
MNIYICMMQSERFYMIQYCTCIGPNISVKSLTLFSVAKFIAHFSFTIIESLIIKVLLNFCCWCTVSCNAAT